jgi:DNA topoisomerase-2
LKRGQKEKDLDVSQKMIQNHLFVFVNALIVNPAFDSQVKAALTTPKNKFGSKCILSERTIKKIVKSTIVTSLRDLADHKANKALKKSDGSLRGDPKVPKHEDASATTKDRHKCTLILTEGDSAKALAMAGLSVVGRKYFGVFPLRGKPINPRDEQVSKIVKNVEFQAIKKILGLKNGEKYTDVSQLRYGKVWIMADADKDGLHIVGLFVNIIIFYWPELAKIPGFLQIFITPVVKASRGKTTLSFESESAYHRWKDANDGGAGWTVKWYKGLGTSTAIEAKEYFSDLPRHTIPFRWGGPLDQAALILAFGKQRQMADARKRWLAAFKVNDPSQPDPVLAMRTAGHVTYEDFVNKQLILYAVANCERHIPSLIDGFKHASRKILFAAFKRNLCREIKVASLAGYVIEQAAYLHGEDSCCGTIVFLAQDYVGSNNLNLLMPSGQFGTRAENGDDAASPRYINTFLSPLARLLFHPHDDMLLVHLKDEGEPIEPVNYLPIIPILLVNGCHGAIGSGWSSKIPRHNPHDIGRLIKTLLDDPTGTVVLTPATHPLKPWVRGFRGEIVVDEKRPGNYIIRGIAKITETEEDGTCTVEITEVPYDMSLSKYVEILQKMKAAETLVKLVNETVEDKIMYRVKLSPKHMKRATEKGGLLKYLHLESSINTNNLVAYDAQGQIKRYATTHEMLNEFFKFRLPYYTKRKQVMIDTLTNELNQLDNRIRFILMVVEEKQIKVRNVAKAVIIHQLAQLHFPPIHNKHHKSNATNANNEPNDGTQADLKDDGVAAAAAAAASGYDYLLGMPLWSLTLERVVALKKKVAEKKAEVKELQNTLPQQMWRQDIDNLLSAIDKYESIRTAQNQEASNRYTKKQTSKKQLSNKKKRSPSTKPKTPKPSKKQSV